MATPIYAVKQNPNTGRWYAESIKTLDRNDTTWETREEAEAWAAEAAKRWAGLKAELKARDAARRAIPAPISSKTHFMLTSGDDEIS